MEPYDKLSKTDQYTYDITNNKCKDCNEYTKCTQDNIGLRYVINLQRYTLDTVECGKKPLEMKFKVFGTYEESILNSELEIHMHSNRVDIYKHMLQGLGGFVYGSVGTGKSTIMRDLAKRLYKKGNNVCYELAKNISVDLKDFNSDDRNSIANKMRLYQTVDILFIDDFARELLTPYAIRDIFGPIIQHRIDNDKPLYISSNYSLAELHDMIEKVTDEITAQAIIDRIKMKQSFKLEGKNYRI